MTKLSPNHQAIVDFVAKREAANLDPMTPAQIGEAIAPEGIKNRTGWGRDNCRKMIEARILNSDDSNTIATTQVGGAAVTPAANKITTALNKASVIVNKVADKFRLTGAKLAAQVKQLDGPTDVRSERAAHLQVYRRMPKILRQTPRKGVTNRKILTEFKSVFDKRTHQYHATKGWRSYSATTA